MSSYPQSSESLSMILIMGVTGSGKSYLINKLAGKNVVEEGARLNSCKKTPLLSEDDCRLDGWRQGFRAVHPFFPFNDSMCFPGSGFSMLYICTSSCTAIPVDIGGQKTVLVDTPGFDDTLRSDCEILSEISQTLVAQYKIGVSLKGVIYLHRIVDNRYSGSAMKTLQIFQKICGPAALKNVILATSRWNEVDESLGTDRESQLRSEFWPYMLAQGSIMTRYYGDEDSALVMASQLLGKSKIILDIQREIVDEHKLLNETAAGVVVSDGLQEQKAQYKQELLELEELRRTLVEKDKAMIRQCQKDWDKERARLVAAEEDLKRLRQDVNRDVDKQLNSPACKNKRLRKGVKIAMQAAPILLSVVGMFVGIPLGCGNILSSWLSESGITDSVADFFGNL